MSETEPEQEDQGGDSEIPLQLATDSTITLSHITNKGHNYVQMCLSHIHHDT